MSRRYDIGEQESSASRGGSNRRKVTVKVCMLDDSMVKFDIEVSAYAVNATTVRAKIITEFCRFLFFCWLYIRLKLVLLFSVFAACDKKYSSCF